MGQADQGYKHVMTGDLRVYETVSLQELNVIGNSGNSTNNRGAFRILSNTQGGAFCENTQLTFTRWKSTIEALEKRVKHGQS